MMYHSSTDINTTNWREYGASSIDPTTWTAIIPAAGRGSRLGYDLPKILYPVAGRPVLHWLLDFLTPNCRQLVFVLSSTGTAVVTEALDRLVAGRFQIVVQENPTGMGDAVALAMPAVTTPNVAVVWGDQAALRRSSVEACIRLHAGPLKADVTCPTVLRPDPYIHFERDGGDGRICGIRQRREGDEMPREGESDTGFFCFRTEVLRQLLSQNDGMERSGRATRESNLLPIIPMASERGFTVISPRIMALEETVGINSRDDVAVVEAFLWEDRAHVEN